MGWLRGNRKLQIGLLLLAPFLLAAIMPGIPVTGIQVSVSGQPGQPVPEPMNTLMTILRQAGLAVVAVAAGPQEVPSVLWGTAG